MEDLHAAGDTHRVAPRKRGQGLALWLALCPGLPLGACASPASPAGSAGYATPGGWQTPVADAKSGPDAPASPDTEGSADATAGPDPAGAQDGATASADALPSDGEPRGADDAGAGAGDPDVGDPEPTDDASQALEDADTADGAAPADGGAEVVDVVVADIQSSADGTSGDAATPWTPPAGGDPGTGCPGLDGTVACSLNGKFRVECNNGAWTALQHCGFGVCQASLSPGGAVVTSCGVPPTQLTALNSACARYTQCFGNTSHEDCVRANLLPASLPASVAPGGSVTVAASAFGRIHSNLDCAAKASTCEQLSACIYLFAVPKCQGAVSGCEGPVAWQCQAGAALASPCGLWGMKCAVLGGQAQCVQAQSCPAPGAVSCADQVASQCVATDDGKQLLLSKDCAAAGLACSAGAGSLANACSGPVVAACKAGTFVPACVTAPAEGGKTAPAKTSNCKGGAVSVSPCPSGTACAVQNDFDLLLPGCPEGQSCALATCTEGGACAMTPRCNGSEVWFCQGKQPVAFDCKAIGANCQASGAGPVCK